MRETSANLVRHAVIAWRDITRGRDPERFDWPATVVRGFKDIVAAVSASLPVSADADGDLAIDVAVAALTLDDDPPSPGTVDLIRQTSRTVVPRVSEFDLVTAFGCGWRPQPLPAREIPHVRWKDAMRVLARLFDGSVNHTVRGLRQMVPEFERLPAQARLRFARDLAMAYAHGTCACGGHVRGCTSKASCQCCRPAHRLAEWRPGTATLAAHVAQATRGRADVRVWTGAYREGMLYPRLKMYGLEVGPLLVHRCPECGHQFSTAGPCPECDTAYDEARFRHEARKNWLVLDVAYGGRHKPEARWSCRKCENLSLERAPCVQCGGDASKRATTVWDLVPATVWLPPRALERAVRSVDERDPTGWALVDSPGDALAALLADLSRTEDPDERALIYAALGELGLPECIPPLVAASGDPDDAVWEVAATALLSLLDRESVLVALRTAGTKLAGIPPQRILALIGRLG